MAASWTSPPDWSGEGCIRTVRHVSNRLAHRHQVSGGIHHSPQWGSCQKPPGARTFCDRERFDNESVLLHTCGVSIRKHWGYFVWGLVSVGLFVWSDWSFNEAEHHEGPGVIFYEEMIGTPVGEQEYKERMKSTGTALLCFGILSTICLIVSARDEWKDARSASLR